MFLPTNALRRSALLLIVSFTAASYQPAYAEGIPKIDPDLRRAKDPAPRDSLSFTDYEGVANYTVTIQIGTDKQAEKYNGRQRCELGADRHWRVTSSLARDGEQDRPRFVPYGFLGNSTRTRSSADYLEPFGAIETRFEVDAFGRLENQSREQQLNLFLGDFCTLAVAPLPVESRQKWTLENPVIVQRVSGLMGSLPGIRLPPRFSGLGGVTLAQGIAAGIEKFDFTLKPGDESVDLIEHQYSLDASKLEPPAQLTGTGVSKFDRRRGVFIEHIYDRMVVMQHAGAETRIPVHVEVRLESDYGLLPLTDQQKTDIAAMKTYEASPEGIAEAKRKADEQNQRRLEIEAEQKKRMAERQAEADQELAPANRQTWIDTFNSGNEYGDGTHALGKLRNVSDREDLELAAAIIGFANRVEPGSLATMFYDLAAKFDAKFAAVKDLRTKLRHSHSDISPPGEAIASRSDLSVGQLILFKVQHGGFRPHVVTELGAKGVQICPIDRDHPLVERVMIENLRLPPPEVAQYLNDELRGLANTPQPNSDAMKTALIEPEFEQWSDRSGRYQLRAQIISYNDPKVSLKHENGKLIEVDINLLNDECAARVRAWHNKDNPFRVISP